MPFYVIQVMPSGIHKLRGREENESDASWLNELEADKHVIHIRGWGNKTQVTEFECDMKALSYAAEMTESYTATPSAQTSRRASTEIKNLNRFTAPIKIPLR